MAKHNDKIFEVRCAQKADPLHGMEYPWRNKPDSFGPPKRYGVSKEFDESDKLWRERAHHMEKGSGFPLDMPPPELVMSEFAKRWLKRGQVYAFEERCWLVSTAARDAFEAIDAQAFVFSPPVQFLIMPPDTPHPKSDFYHLCQIHEPETGPFYLCDIVRALDVLDVERSPAHCVSYWSDGSLHFSASTGQALFRRQTLGDHHIFRLTRAPGFIGCDATFVAAMKRAGIDFLTFKQAGQAMDLPQTKAVPMAPEQSQSDKPKPVH